MTHQKTKNAFKKFGTVSLWMMLSAGLVVLLVAAMDKKNSEKINRVTITVSGVGNEYFIDKSEITNQLEKINGKRITDTKYDALNLTAMETGLLTNEWIGKAEIFIDNNNVLQVSITERDPIARIFTTSGASFYVDSALNRLPLSDKFAARVPVFTSFPADVRVLTHADSMLMRQIVLLSTFIAHDPFWMAQIEQTNISPEYKFEFTPKLGEQVIRFGNINNYKEKFVNLFAFYKQVQYHLGWKKYSVLDLQYKGQVVAINRDQQAIKEDSLKAVQIMKNIIAEAQRKSNDSTSVQLPLADETGNSPGFNNNNSDEQPKMNSSENLPATTNKSVQKTSIPPQLNEEVKDSDKKNLIPQVKKQIEKSKKAAGVKDTSKPKAVMPPPKTDY